MPSARTANRVSFVRPGDGSQTPDARIVVAATTDFAQIHPSHTRGTDGSDGDTSRSMNVSLFDRLLRLRTTPVTMRVAAGSGALMRAPPLPPLLPGRASRVGTLLALVAEPSRDPSRPPERDNCRTCRDPLRGRARTHARRIGDVRAVRRRDFRARARRVHRAAAPPPPRCASGQGPAPPRPSDGPVPFPLALEARPVDATPSDRASRLTLAPRPSFSPPRNSRARGAPLRRRERLLRVLGAHRGRDDAHRPPRREPRGANLRRRQRHAGRVAGQAIRLLAGRHA
eukprot:31314-Pelagococcus_subviridis.AAC.41